MAYSAKWLRRAWEHSSAVGASTMTRGELRRVIASLWAASSARSACTSGSRYASVLPLPAHEATTPHMWQPLPPGYNNVQ